jgi:DNA adenine methylase
VCDSDSVTTRLGTTAIFLDPPYPLTRADTGKKSRAGGLYQGDDTATLNVLRDEVLAYCVERGPRKGYRICLACYEGDGYEMLAKDHGWSVVEWAASGGYANRGKNKENRQRERLYFSPGCVREATLFDEVPQ